MEIINNITQYLVALGPAVAALVGMVATVVVGIKQMKAANTQTVQEVKDNNELTVKEVKTSNEQAEAVTQELKATLCRVEAENMELKRQLTTVINKLNKVYIVDKKDDNGQSI